MALIQHGAQHKDSEFFFAEELEVVDQGLNRSHDEVVVAILKHSLDDSATVFINCKIKNARLNFFNKVLHHVELEVLPHLLDDPLDNMIPIEVKATVLYIPFFNELLPH